MITIQKLISIGKIWLAKVRLQDEDPSGVSEQFTELVGELNVKLGRGWQKYDPVIRRGRPQSYEQLFRELDQNAQANANAFIAYYQQGIPEDTDLSPVIILILIACVCEVGRGYGNAPGNLAGYISHIARGRLAWKDLLSPAYVKDLAFLCQGDTDGEWTPN